MSHLSGLLSDLGEDDLAAHSGPGPDRSEAARMLGLGSAVSPAEVRGTGAEREQHGADRRIDHVSDTHRSSPSDRRRIASTCVSSEAGRPGSFAAL